MDALIEPRDGHRMRDDIFVGMFWQFDDELITGGIEVAQVEPAETQMNLSGWRDLSILRPWLSGAQVGTVRCVFLKISSLMQHGASPRFSQAFSVRVPVGTCARIPSPAQRESRAKKRANLGRNR